MFAGRDSAFAYTLVVHWIASDTIEFRMDVADPASGRRREVAGRGTTRFVTDPEQDDDDASGEAYDSQQYDYTRGDCSLEVRIDLSNPPTRAVTSGAAGCGAGLADWSPTLRRIAGSYHWPSPADSSGDRP